MDRVAILDLLKAQQLILNAAIEALEDSVFMDPPASLPTHPVPTLYTIREGGDWFAWPMRHTVGGMERRIHAIKFADGSILDTLNGWRPSVTIVAESK